MQRNTAVLKKKDYEVVVIGGGIFGACAAWDAALRGYSVALVEQKDFASGTSANSFKMIHGGIRYIQHGDIVRLRESCDQRSIFLRIAPHLVEPLPIVIPTYGHLKKGKEILAIGMYLYDLLTLDRNSHIKDPNRKIPWTGFLNKKEVLELFPGLSIDQLTGAAVFSDGQMYNPTRLVLSFIRAAVEKGADVVNYVEVLDFLNSDGCVRGVSVRDGLSGELFEIRAKVVLNTVGPWSEGLLGRQPSLQLNKKGTYSRDVCFVVPKKVNHNFALAAQGRTSDPDAILSRPARHLFVVPWKDYTLIGVWHKIHNDPDNFTVSREELLEYIEEINWAYPTLNLKLDDVLMWNAGLLPFGEKQTGENNLSYGKRSTLVDHNKKHGIKGLVTLIGIRYTMGRGDAEKAIDIIAKQIGKRSPRCQTAKTPVYGGNIENFSNLVKEIVITTGLSEKLAQSLAHNYGSEYRQVVAYANIDKSLMQAIGNSTVIKAEVHHAIHEEMAIHLADVVFRRTDLATAGNPGQDALQECASIMRNLLNWDEEQTQIEIDNTKKIFPEWIRD